jgi:hypothetical protein
MARPPTIHDLLDDPVYRKMLLTPPAIPGPLTWGDPFMLWAQREDGVWASKAFPTYRDAWAKAVPIIKDRDKYTDLAIVSKRVFLPPPRLATWPVSLSWCSRCRRPSSFQAWDPARHHALKRSARQAILTDDEPYRCWYCGIRRCAMPYYPRGGFR